MWIAKYPAGKKRQPADYSGSTPAQVICARSGEEFTVGACEHRTLPYCAPYGIYTKPPKGEDMLILSAQSGEVCLGVVSSGDSLLKESLLPGEVMLCSAGGASIRLCNDGRILLNGKQLE